jgi:hypothetical protein
MSIFSALVKITVDVVTLPIDVIKDVVTLGGVSTDQKKPYTLQKLDQIKEDADD